MHQKKDDEDFFTFNEFYNEFEKNREDNGILKIDPLWLKIKKYPAFWWMLLIVTFTYPGTTLLSYYAYTKSIRGKEMTNTIAKMLLGNPFAFPETWHSFQGYLATFG